MDEHPLQPFRCVARDRRPALEQLVHMLSAVSLSLGQLCAGPTAIVEDLVDQIPGGARPSRR
jgi:hypothetical protein